MSIENPFNITSQPQEEVTPDRSKKPNAFSRFTKKAAMIGTLAFGLGAAPDVQAPEGSQYEGSDGPSIAAAETAMIRSRETENLVENLYEDENNVWGIEYVPTTNTEGKKYLAMNLFKTPIGPGDSIVLA